jgi:HSP20 family molecular chaperone IbpA
MNSNTVIGGPGSRLKIEHDAAARSLISDFSGQSCAGGTGCTGCSRPKQSSVEDRENEQVAKNMAELRKNLVSEQKKVDTDNFVWFNPEFTFSVIPGSDGKFRTRVPVPGCDVKDVTVTQTGNKVEVKSQLKLKDAHCTNVAVGTIPVGHKLKSTTLKEGLLTLLTETVTPDLSETRKIPVRAVRSTNGYSHY